VLAGLRARGDPDAVAALAPLLGQLERHHKPLSAMAWLERSPAAATFHAMLRGEISISLQTLDEHDVGQTTAYLRSWLVAHRILEPREELLPRYEGWAHHALQALADHPDRAHVAAYARWKIGPDYARKLIHWRRAAAGDWTRYASSPADPPSDRAAPRRHSIAMDPTPETAQRPSLVHRDRSGPGNIQQGLRSPPHYGDARAFRRFEYTTSARGVGPHRTTAMPRRARAGGRLASRGPAGN
jgi:hypothetical protein